MQPIFTLNARSNVMLEVTRDCFNLSSQQMLREIKGMHRQVVDILSNKNIKYSDLKTALVPSINRREVALIFDTEKIKSNCYGLVVFEKLLPLLSKKSNHSIKCGDLLDSFGDQKLIFNLLSDSICLNKPVEYIHSTQFYIVYLNNLSGLMKKNLIEGLSEFDAFVGHIPLTNESMIKAYISDMLVSLCLKHRDLIIMGHEDDRPNSENVNMTMYPFEENGFKCISLQSSFYGVFLSYKIERAIYEEFEVDTDTEFSLNCVTDTILPLSDLRVYIDDEKFKHLKTEKAGKFKRAGLKDFSKDRLVSLIESKVSSNYLYNLVFMEEYNVIKFNILIEVCADNLAEPTKLLVSIEYKPEEQILRVITLH